MGNFLGPWIIILIGIFVAYFICSSLSRIFSHPLRDVPGPKIAALTWLYTAYYDLIRDGGMVEQLEKLHEIYGPIVRIGPNELHFSDPQAFRGIYSTGSKFVKDPRLYGAFADGSSSFSSCDPREAKIRKDAVSPLFSRRAILKLESVVQEKVDKLVNALLRYNRGHSVNIDAAFHSTTLDIITSYCFGYSDDTLGTPDFQHPIIADMQASLLLLWYFRYFPIVRRILLLVSERFGWNWYAVAFLDMRLKLSNQIDAILADPTLLQTAEHETVFHHLITPLPTKSCDGYEMLSKINLMSEAKSLMFAGSDTVANTCKIGSFYVLNDQAIYSRLVKELEEAWPDKESKVGLDVLERLPYLTAVIKESLRIAPGVVSGPARIVGPDSATIAGLDIPIGTVVSMGSTFVHKNADIFPDPFTFCPNRWLQPNSNELDPYLVSFSKGPRSCFGINLAWCELYLIFANLFRMIEMAIDQTTVEDLKFRAYFLPVFRGRPLRVFVKG